MKKDKNAKKHGLRHLIFFIVLFLPVIYILFQLFLIFWSKPFRTQTAIKYTLPETVTADAIIAMPQENVPFGGGITSYVVSDGERVSRGNILAQVFDSAEQAQNMHRAQSIDKEIALLQSAQSSQIGVNIDTLLNQKLSKTYSMLDVIYSKQYEELARVKSELQLAENKLQISTDKSVSFTSRIDELTVQKDAASAAAGAADNIAAPSGGYFVSGANCSKQLYSPQELEAMDALTLSEAASSSNQPNDENIVGKIVLDYRWKCYLSVDSKEAKKFVEGAKVNLSFNEISDKQMPAQVQSVKIDEVSGLAKIVLSCDYLNGDVAALQNAVATVTFREYSGLRIDKSALRVINGNYGVYIKYGNLAQYRKIDVLYENDDYLLVSALYEKGKNELQLYDEVIVEGRNLQDGKVI